MADVKSSETFPGGAYVVDDVLVNANGVPLTDEEKATLAKDYPELNSALQEASPKAFGHAEPKVKKVDQGQTQQSQKPSGKGNG
jgi:hypothetical protein